MADAVDIRDRGWSIAETRPQWGWFVALGIGFLILGAIAFANLAIATVATILFIAAMMLIGGIAQVIHAFQVRTWSGFFFWLLSGLLYAVAGLIAVFNPLLASLVLTLLFGAALVAAGVVRIWIGYKARPEPGWGWVMAAGVVTLLAGIVIALGWPVNSLWLLGLVLAVDLIMQGVAMISVGTGLRARGSA